MPTVYNQCLKEGKEWQEYDALKDAVVYNIDKTAREYWRSARTDWDIKKGHFPNLLPIDPSFFIQYEMPTYSFTAEGWAKTEYEQHAFLFMGYPVELDPNYELLNKDAYMLLRWFPYSMIEGELFRHGNSMTIGLDSKGKILPLKPGDEMLIDDISGAYSTMPREILKVYVDTVFATLHPCLIWISNYHERLKSGLN